MPKLQFISIAGAGNPNNDSFSDYIEVLYTIAYAIKMNLKKLEMKPDGYQDYTVYPLEGVWDINAEAKKTNRGFVSKDDLVFNLMIRQPNFVDESFFTQMRQLVQKKKTHTLLEHDHEKESFDIMEKFAKKENLIRMSKVHREIYLSDFRKVAPEKLKTVLRFQIS